MKNIPPVFEETTFASPVSAKKKPASPRVVIALCVTLAVLLGFYAYSKWRTAEPYVSPLEPTSAVQTVPVPAEAQDKVMSAAATLSSAPAASSTAANMSSETKQINMLEPSASEPLAQDFASLKVRLSELMDRLGQLETVLRDHDDKLTILRAEAERTAAARSSANAQPAPTSRPRAPAASQQVAKTDASVLAVDMWGGKPSVAVGKSGEVGTELRFLGEGETHGNVTLKRGEVATQRATFVTPGGEVTLAPKAR